MKYTAEEVRALFEAWAEENGYDVLRIEPDYNDGFTAAAWHGYQAAYAERIEADKAKALGTCPKHGVEYVGECSGCAMTLPEKDFTHLSAQAARCDKPGCNCATWKPEGCAWDDAEPVAQGESAWLERLKDPATVHALMLRGVIAIPSIRSMVDLRGEVPNGEDVQLLRIAELQEQLAAQPAQSVDVEAIREVIEVRDWLLARAQDGQMQRSVYTSNYQLREMAEAINVFADELEAALQEKGK